MIFGILIILQIACIGFAIAITIRIRNIERKLHNLEVEVYLPIAESQMPDKTTKQRITLAGAVKALVMKENGVKVKEKPPVIHRV